MKRVYYILLCLVAVSLSSLGAQEITRVEEVSKKIEIDCRFTQPVDNVQLQVSQDGGKTFSAPLKEVVFKNGTVTWNPIAEYGSLVGENISFKVTAMPPPQDMIFVEGGTFQMGYNNGDSDEKPVHSVTLASFYIGKYEVTQAEWEVVMGSNPSYFKGANNPVEKVTWYDCIIFCNAKSRKEGREECYQISGTTVTLLANKNGYRLPTEAEWEFAARGGNKGRGYNYSGSNMISSVAWYKDNSNNSTHNVGTKQCNELGIYDMTGNVWEWCWDWHGSYSSISQTNPTGAATGSERINRGGCFYSTAPFCHSANRNDYAPTRSGNLLGLRLVFVP